MTKLAGIVQRQLKHDAPYAWHLRNQSASHPAFRLRHLAELDSRLESYLTCFQLSPQERDALLAKLKPIDWGVVFITALVGLRDRDAAVFERAVAMLAEAQQAKELSDALCRAGIEAARPFLHTLATHENPLARIAAIMAGGYFHIEQDIADVESLLDDTPAVVVATVKVIGRNKRRGYRSAITRLLQNPNDAIRFQAAYAGCLLSIPEAVPVLQGFCWSDNPHLRDALGLIYHVLPVGESLAVLTRIHESALSPRIKAHSLAMAGLPEKIPILMEWLDDPEYAPIAAEAFSFITGVDIEDDDLSILHVEVCESHEQPLAVRRKKDRWTQFYETDLPWPDPDLVAKWWNTHQDRLQNGTRYLAGYPLNNDNLQNILIEGTQTQRQAASLILAVNNPDRMVEDVTVCCAIHA